METQQLETSPNQPENGANEPKVPKATARLKVPNYPYPLVLEVQLVPELSAYIEGIINPDERSVMAGNVIFNMLNEAMMNAAEEVEKEKSPIITA